ncbi:NADH:flavin oxidoreductase/NADH oxidase [Amycolatopsis acidiphila]|uniref:NADH:flavin oxidoreductase/NADH oxidase n=1 Tax=Amycolatopsis acidiphila TaxID=715473 RepID=UPI0027E58B2F|nr:NADH:flavin oxidoreductase/NADH oxidase [Amycolatopsis acidiphila]
MTVSRLFEPYRVRNLTLPNRIWVSPMCQYSAADGLPGDWHLMHLGQFATGGAGLVMTEATAVTAVGRITPQDTGIWNDEQVAAWRRITGFLHAQGAVTGIQLAHAGRKGSSRRPWEGNATVPAEEGGWTPVGPSAVAFGNYVTPRELTTEEVAEIPGQFAAAARRSLTAGFDVLELHFAHGYLAHQFYSPLSNNRTDRYGGDFEGRTRLLLEIADAVRAEVGETVPVFARLSATDWVEGGWTIDDSVRVAKLLAERGIDLIDASTGGNHPKPDIPVGPGYQVPFAERIRTEAGMPTGAVGMITEPEQADEIVASGAADGVFLARALLRDPHWPLRAAHTLGDDVRWPDQYARAKSWH